MVESIHLITNSKNVGKYCDKNHTKEEVEIILAKLKENIYSHLDGNIVEPMLGLNNDKNNLFLDISGLKSNSYDETKFNILNLFINLTVDDFCHSEEDSAYPGEYLYCFKITVDYSKEAMMYEDQLKKFNVATTQELYLKFKFKHIPECIIFTMSYHFPTTGLATWSKKF